MASSMRCRRSGGSRACQPAVQAMRVGELVDEARLAHPRLADDRRQLPVAGAGELLRAAKLVQLGVAATKRVSPRRAPAWSRVRAGPAPVTSSRAGFVPSWSRRADRVPDHVGVEQLALEHLQYTRVDLPHR
jgi:hypothetical protein